MKAKLMAFAVAAAFGFSSIGLAALSKEERKAEAQDRTSDPQQELELLAGLLKATLVIDDKVDWESLKDKGAFPEPRPKATRPPPLTVIGWCAKVI